MLLPEEVVVNLNLPSACVAHPEAVIPAVFHIDLSNEQRRKKTVIVEKNRIAIEEALRATRQFGAA